MVYRWKSGASFKVPASVAVDRIETIREANEGNVAPADIVQDARPPDASLHAAFEWDDHKAAELHREGTARRMLRSIVEVSRRDDEAEIPRQSQVYVSVGTPRSGACYTTVARAMTDEELRLKVLDDALRQLNGLRNRFGHLRELSAVFEAIEEAAETALQGAA